MKMKKINIKIISIFFLALLGLLSCEKEMDELHVGTSNSFFTVSNADKIFAPANVYFTNGSKYGESYTWTFKGGNVIINGQLSGLETSDKIEPEKVYYALPGEYIVKLDVTAEEGVKTFIDTIQVLKPQPRIYYQPAGILYGEEVNFTCEIFKYQGEENNVTYEWDFGDGSAKVNTDQAMHVFASPGIYTVTLTVNDGHETLTATKVILVKKAVVRSLFVTDALTGKLYKKMLYSDVDDEPYTQLPVNCGIHPLSVNVYNDRIIISDAGNHIKYSAFGTDADGRIFTTNLIGQDEYTITSGADLNGSGNEYINDPFVTAVDENGMLYWLDRFQGVRKMSYLELNAPYPNILTTPMFATVAAADLGESSTYGWTDGGVRIIDGELWYSKHGTGKGLFKFNLTDGKFMSKIAPLYEYKIRSFDVDLENFKIYFVIDIASGAKNIGFYVSDIDGNNVVLLDDFKEGTDAIQFSDEGGAAEPTSVTSIVVDNKSGYVYFPFRHKEDISTAGLPLGNGSKSGVKRYKLDGSEQVEWYFKGLVPYGIGMDYELR
jgi:PKD repeat protein